MGSSRERSSVNSKHSVASGTSKEPQLTEKETASNANTNDVSKNNLETKSVRSSQKSHRSRVASRFAARRSLAYPHQNQRQPSVGRNSNLSQISYLLSGKSEPQEKPPTKVTHILQKRTPYVKYDPWKNVEEGPIQLLLRNEVAKGRLKSQDNDMKEEHEKKLRALRHWGYLRRVAKAIGRNQREMKLREKARLEEEMEQKRQALAEEEALMEKAKQEAAEIEKREKEADEEKREAEEAESIDYDGVDLLDATLQARSQSLSLPLEPKESGQRESDPRLVHSLNDLPTVDDMAQEGCNLTRDPFSGQMVPMFSTSSLRHQSSTQGGTNSRTRLLDISTDDESYTQKDVGGPVIFLEEDQLIYSQKGLEVDLPPPPPPYPPPMDDDETEELLVTNRRSIFAAPSWNPEIEGDLERVHKELMERPLAYSGVEKAVDVPDHLQNNLNQEGYSSTGKNEVQPVLNVQIPPRKFVFVAPSVQTMEMEKAARDEQYYVSLDNESSSKEDNFKTDDSEMEKGDTDEKEGCDDSKGDDSVFEREEEEEKEGEGEEEQKSVEVNKSFDWMKEYERRRDEIHRQKKDLENLEQKALRFQEDDVVATATFEKTYVREFLHGYSILPENYTGKIAISIHYGVSQYIPVEARIKNAKEQLYVGVSHIFDFSRVESLNKKRPMVAFKLRPFDKSFQLPKGADKYREVGLNRKTGEVSGDTSFCTFEIPQKAILKRWLFIRVKAYHKNFPQNFLGEVKIDFRDYEKAEDIQIMDRVAYLYGKFEQVGSMDVEMNYKVQQGCLVITVIKANLLPTVKSTGDTYIKIYHTYMGRMVEKVKTAVLLETFMPEYNESFTFKLPRGMVDESNLHFKLMSKPAVAVSKDTVTGEVKLAQRTNCNDWKNFFVGALMCKHPVPTQATLPLMRYTY